MTLLKIFGAFGYVFGTIGLMIVKKVDEFYKECQQEFRDWKDR